jgi:4-amino-4-deoxy-L-arabinose transferase-like glycosyltransferase
MVGAAFFKSLIGSGATLGDPRDSGKLLTSVVLRDITALTLLALTLRAAYVFVGLRWLDLASFSMSAPDSTTYMNVAEYILTGLGRGKEQLLYAGPGYGWLLVCLRLWFGAGPLPPLVLNVLLGCLAPAVIYLLALRLVERRWIAILAGLIVAVSFTGVSLSTNILTDQPFYTLHAAGILLFLIGLKTDRRKWFVAAGVVAGLANYVRGLGQYWPLIFVAWALLLILPDRSTRRRGRILRSLWTPGIMIVMIFGWSAHNHVKYGLFTYSVNGVSAAWAYLAPRAVADHTEGKDIRAVRAEWSEEIWQPLDGREPTLAERQKRMKAMLVQLLQEQPEWLLSTYLTTVWENMSSPNYFVRAQIPRLNRIWNGVLTICRNDLSPRLFWLTLLSLGVLVVRRQWEAFLVLGTTYAYFTLITGFSFWQGSRLHFPAEMAWSILIAYLAVETVRGVAWLLAWLGSRRAAGTA